MNQLAIPVEVPLPELMRKQTLGAAIEMCVELSGHPTKAVLSDLHVDKAQLSRWHSGAEGVVWPKLAALMDRCGNDAPVLWQLQAELPADAAPHLPVHGRWRACRRAWRRGECC